MGNEAETASLDVVDSPTTQTITIEGVPWSYEFFKAFAEPPDGVLLALRRSSKSTGSMVEITEVRGVMAAAAYFEAAKCREHGDIDEQASEKINGPVHADTAGGCPECSTPTTSERFEKAYHPYCSFGCSQEAGERLRGGA